MLRTHKNATRQLLPTQILQPAIIRLQKEFSDLDIPPQCRVTLASNESVSAEQAAISKPEELSDLVVTISPDDGHWRGAHFKFNVTVPPSYPHDPPKIRCQTPVYHPNIDENGAVCLNILREEWRPVLSLYAAIVGLLHLFLNPGLEDPLNKEAAEELATNPAAFARKVRSQKH